MAGGQKSRSSSKRSSSQPDFDLADFIKEFEKAYGKAVKDLGRFNLVIFGDTGTGKSTLINAVFGDEVAQAGAGRPVTQSTNYYEHPSGILGIYDTKGIETGRSEEQVLEDLDEIISSKRSLPLEEQIHVIWYCLSPSPPRWESAQARFVRELADESIPILFVLTQVKKKPDGSISPEVEHVIEAIEQDDLPTHPDGRVFQTLAEDDDWGGYKAHGLPELLDATFQVAPAGIRNALTAAQQIDVPRKVAQARNYVKAASTAAAAAGATPIPFSDAVVLVPIQTTMMAKIGAIFGWVSRRGLSQRSQAQPSQPVASAKSESTSRPHS